MYKISGSAYILLIILAFNAQRIYSQAKSISVQRKVISVDEFDVNKVFNKKTNKKISGNKVIKENPNLPFERVYDKMGNIERYLYDPDNLATFIVPDRNAKAKKGELFPEFLFETSTGLRIDSNELIGKITLIRFMGTAEDYRMKMEEIKELDEKIENSTQKEQIEAFIIFENDPKSIKRLFTLKDSNFEVIPNGRNFHRKFHITRMPTTVILNPDFTVEGWYNYSEDINLETILKD